jgi:hypothetical protein
VVNLAAIGPDNHVPIVGIKDLARSGIGTNETILANDARTACNVIERIKGVLVVVLSPPRRALVSHPLILNWWFQKN